MLPGLASENAVSEHGVGIFPTVLFVMFGMGGVDLEVRSASRKG